MTQIGMRFGELRIQFHSAQKFITRVAKIFKIDPDPYTQSTEIGGVRVRVSG